jgi:tight adherence protein B
MTLLISILISLSCLLIFRAGAKYLTSGTTGVFRGVLSSVNPLAPSDTPHRGTRISIAIAVLAAVVAVIAMLIPFWPLLGVSALMPIVPGIQRWLRQRRHTRDIYLQMDGMLANLANAIPVSGNLRNAIEDVTDGEPEPMRTELLQALHEIRLGKTEDDALRNLAVRCRQPLFRTAITAIIVGKTSGGSLEKILSGTAASIRELKRLDGVLKTRTSEARMQAWVIGLVPFVLCGALQLVNPEWLTPMWTTLFGNILLVVAGVMEVTAVLLIRKILSVEL